MTRLWRWSSSPRVQKNMLWIWWYRQVTGARKSWVFRINHGEPNKGEQRINKGACHKTVTFRLSQKPDQYQGETGPNHTCQTYVPMGRGMKPPGKRGRWALSCSSSRTLISHTVFQGQTNSTQACDPFARFEYLSFQLFWFLIKCQSPVPAPPGRKGLWHFITG